MLHPFVPGDWLQYAYTSPMNTAVLIVYAADDTQLCFRSHGGYCGTVLAHEVPGKLIKARTTGLPVAGVPYGQRFGVYAPLITYNVATVAELPAHFVPMPVSYANVNGYNARAREGVRVFIRTDRNTPDGRSVVCLATDTGKLVDVPFDLVVAVDRALLKGTNA